MSTEIQELIHDTHRKNANMVVSLLQKWIGYKEFTKHSLTKNYTKTVNWIVQNENGFELLN